MLKGEALDMFRDDLVKVGPEYQEKPRDAFDFLAAIGERVTNYARARYGEEYLDDIDFLSRALPYRALLRLSVDQICKVRASSSIMLDDSVEDLFKNDPRFRIVEKIRSSMWRWSSRAPWNEMVDAYDGVRAFDLDVPGFEVRLDYTRSVNECGTSEHSATFLDGALAYLVYHKGEHVMTLGFSILNDYRVLIQQIQLKNRTGNRWLFRYPKNRVEHAIECFARAFPQHSIYLVDGEDVANKSLRSYERGRATCVERVKDTRERLVRYAKNGTDGKYEQRSLDSNIQRISELDAKIEHITPEVARLGAFYRGCGRFTLGATIKKNDMRHYRVA